MKSKLAKNQGWIYMHEEVIKSIEMPIEARWRYASESMWGTWVGCSVNYAEEFGWDKANERVIHRTDVEGGTDADYAIKQLGIEERDATTALRAGLFLIVNLYPDHGTKILEYSSDRAVAEWSVCTQCTIAKDLKIEDRYDMFQLCETWWKRIAKTVDPNLDAKLENALCGKNGSCKVAIWK
jgi:hypothetical protein